MRAQDLFGGRGPAFVVPDVATEPVAHRCPALACLLHGWPRLWVSACAKGGASVTCSICAAPAQI